jgi:hypothetical protein
VENRARSASGERRAASDGRRATDDERRATDDERRTTDDEPGRDEPWGGVAGEETSSVCGLPFSS